MHEYSLADNLIQSIISRLETENVHSPEAVKELTLRVGALEVHSVESFRRALEMRSGNTLLEQAKLNIEIVPGRFKCDKCGHEQQTGIGDTDAHAALPAVECPKCGSVCIVQGGRGIDPIDIVIEPT